MGQATILAYIYELDGLFINGTTVPYYICKSIHGKLLPKQRLRFWRHLRPKWSSWPSVTRELINPTHSSGREISFYILCRRSQPPTLARTAHFAHTPSTCFWSDSKWGLRSAINFDQVRVVAKCQTAWASDQRNPSKFMFSQYIYKCMWLSFSSLSASINHVLPLLTCSYYLPKTKTCCSTGVK